MGLRPKGVGGTHDLFGLSENLWGNYPIDWIFGLKDQDYGWGVIDSFKTWGIATAQSSGLAYYQSEGNTYRAYEKAGSSAGTRNIVPDNTRWTVPTGYPIQNAPAGNLPNGLSNILIPAASQLWTPGQLKFGSVSSADSDQASIQMGPDTATTNVCPFSVVPSYSGTLLFEARIKVHTTIGYVSGSSGTTFFIGLAGPAAAVVGVPCAAQAFDTAVSKIGFGCVAGDTQNTLYTVYSRTTGAVREVSTALLTLGAFPNSTYPTIGVDSYFKVGFRYEGTAQRMIPFVNGIAQDGNQGTNQIIGPATVGGSTSAYGTSSSSWPNDALALCKGICSYGAVGPYVTVDWWAAAQMPNPGAHGQP
jgi:hypothetical protein